MGVDYSAGPDVTRTLFTIVGETHPTLDELQYEYTRHVLDHVRGNKSAAARILGVDRRSIYRILGRKKTDLATSVTRGAK